MFINLKFFTKSIQFYTFSNVWRSLLSKNIGKMICKVYPSLYMYIKKNVYVKLLRFNISKKKEQMSLNSQAKYLIYYTTFIY